MAKETEQTTTSTVGTHETGAVEHERVAQPEINLGREREYETGMDEAWKAQMLEISSRDRNHYDRMKTNALTQDHSLNQVSLQALQNAVENANQLAKQNLQQIQRHNDIATDRQWNVDEQGYTVAEILRNETFKDAIAGAVAVAVADILNKKE